MTIISLLFLLPLSLVTSQTVDPYLPGPYHVDFTSINPDLFGMHLDHHLDVFSPHSEGSFPVIVFFPGMSCTIAASTYSTILSHLASWGYVVLGPWAVFYNPVENYKAKWVDKVLTWAKGHLNEHEIRTNLGLHTEGSLDFNRMSIAAQSSGAHVAVEFLKMSEEHCDMNLQSLLLLSPVDGLDPFGFIPDFCVNPGTLLNFKTPSLIISGGLDSQKGIGSLGDLMPACAPQDMSNDRFYNAMAGPTIMQNYTSYGHIDCMDQDMIDVIQAIHFCASDPNQDMDIYKQILAGQMVAFLQFVTEGNCDMGQVLLEDVINTDVDVTVKIKNGVENICGESGCQWQQDPNSVQ